MQKYLALGHSILTKNTTANNFPVRPSHPVIKYIFRHPTSKVFSRVWTSLSPISRMVTWDIFKSMTESPVQAWITRSQFLWLTTASSITTIGGILCLGSSVVAFCLIESGVGRVSRIFIPATSLSETGRFIANLQNAVVPWTPVKMIELVQWISQSSLLDKSFQCLLSIITFLYIIVISVPFDEVDVVCWLPFPIHISHFLLLIARENHSE